MRRLRCSCPFVWSSQGGAAPGFRLSRPMAYARQCAGQWVLLNVRSLAVLMPRPGAIGDAGAAVVVAHAPMRTRFGHMCRRS